VATRKNKIYNFKKGYFYSGFISYSKRDKRGDIKWHIDITEINEKRNEKQNKIWRGCTDFYLNRWGLKRMNLTWRKRNKWIKKRKIKLKLWDWDGLGVRWLGRENKAETFENTVGPPYYLIKCRDRNGSGTRFPVFGSLFPVFWSNREREFPVFPDRVTPGQRSEPVSLFYRIPL